MDTFHSHLLQVALMIEGTDYWAITVRYVITRIIICLLPLKTSHCQWLMILFEYFRVMFDVTANTALSGVPQQSKTHFIIYSPNS